MEMAITNKSVELKRKTSTGAGSFSKTSLGTYDVWLEGLDTREQRSIGGITNERAIPHGIIFLFTEIDLTDCFVVYGGNTFPITSFDVLYDRDGDFHHIEALFSR